MKQNGESILGAFLGGRFFATGACLLLLFAARSHGQAFGGGALAQPTQDCISPKDRARIENVLSLHAAAMPPSTTATAQNPSLYPFWPQAGNLWGDLFVNNFTD